MWLLFIDFVQVIFLSPIVHLKIVCTVLLSILLVVELVDMEINNFFFC